MTEPQLRDAMAALARQENLRAGFREVPNHNLRDQPKSTGKLCRRGRSKLVLEALRANGGWMTNGQISKAIGVKDASSLMCAIRKSPQVKDLIEFKTIKHPLTGQMAWRYRAKEGVEDGQA